MSIEQIAIWSMALGAVGTFGLARLVDLLARSSFAQAQGAAYHFTVFFLILILSGVLGTLWPGLPAEDLQHARILAGPVCVGLSNIWLRGWLHAGRRDRIMSDALRASAVLLPLAALGCIALPAAQQVLAAAALALVGASLTLWMTVRAWRMGDALAPVMATGCLLALPAIGGLYAITLGASLPALVHVVLALTVALSNGFIGLALWRRHRQEWQTREPVPAHVDPVTRLHSGAGLVRKLIKAQRRRRRTGRDGAVVALMVFNMDHLIAQAGNCGVNEAFMALASRIQRQVGVVNPVGRYYDRCFVSLMETIHSPSALRTLGLRVASSARRPIPVQSASGERIEVAPDIGVGVVHLSRKPAALEDILHDAQRLAQAARGMRSRAAMRDPTNGEIVPVEHANLRPRRRGQMQTLARTA